MWESKPRTARLQMRTTQQVRAAEDRRPYRDGRGRPGSRSEWPSPRCTGSKPPPRLWPPVGREDRKGRCGRTGPHGPPCSAPAAAGLPPRRSAARPAAPQPSRRQDPCPGRAGLGGGGGRRCPRPRGSQAPRPRSRAGAPKLLGSSAPPRRCLEQTLTLRSETLP